MAEKMVDPTSDYETLIDVNASSTSWSITIIVNGMMGDMPIAPEATGLLESIRGEAQRATFSLELARRVPARSYRCVTYKSNCAPPRVCGKNSWHPVAAAAGERRGEHLVQQQSGRGL
jgi:hypothetical protein